MLTEREYLAQRARLMDEARALNEKAEAQTRDFTTDEQKTWDKNQADIKALDSRWQRAQLLQEEPEDLNAQPVKATKAPGQLKGGRGDNFAKALRAYLVNNDKGGLRGLMHQNEVDIRASNNTDMNIGTPADGGYVDPTGFYQNVIAKRSEMSLPDRLGVMQIPGKGTTVDVPYDDETDGEFVSTAEGIGFDQDAPALGQAQMTLVKYTKYITLSVELLEDEDAKLMNFLTNWVARGQAKTYNQLLLTEVATNGTSFKTTASATAIVAGEVEATAFNDTVGDYLDDSGSVAWVMKPSTYGAIMSIVGNPRLYAGAAADKLAARSLLEMPAYFSVKAGAMTAGLKSVYFGNWSFVGQREAPGFTMLRDPYSAAGTGQVKLWMYFRTVFKVLQPSAIGYLIMHA